MNLSAVGWFQLKIDKRSDKAINDVIRGELQPCIKTYGKKRIKDYKEWLTQNTEDESPNAKPKNRGRG